MSNFQQECLISNKCFWVLNMAVEKESEFGSVQSEIKALRATQALKEKALDEVCFLASVFSFRVKCLAQSVRLSCRVLCCFDAQLKIKYDKLDEKLRVTETVLQQKVYMLLS